MSERYPGGYITKNAPQPTGGESGTAPGVWTLEEAAEYQKAGTWPAPAKNYIENVFSTYLYAGNGSTQTITNNINLSAKGGLVWVKGRTSPISHVLIDTVRGVSKYLNSNTTDAQQLVTGFGVTNFGSSGFTVVDDSNGNYGVNGSGGAFGGNYVSWTFAKTEKFFDVVTFTGPTTGNTITVNHNLGSVPGCIIYRSYENSDSWYVWHQSLATNNYLYLNSTVGQQDQGHNINATSTSFSLRAGYNIASNMGGCIAYIFANDAGGFGVSGTDNVISCGSYVGNGSSIGPIVTLGYEPQWLLLKNITTSGPSWFIFDNMRGVFVNGNDARLVTNTDAAESNSLNLVEFNSTGFQITYNGNAVNGNGDNYIYIAIRRGPMKTPTNSTTVFTPVARSGTGSTSTVSNSITTDLIISHVRNTAGIETGVWDRLRGFTKYLATTSSAVESTGSDSVTAMNNTAYVLGADSSTDRINRSGYTYANWTFSRAPSFFDEVCYAGDGGSGTRTINHNLTVAPELLIIKTINIASANWIVGSTGAGWTKYGVLNSTNNFSTSDIFANTAPTSSVFSIRKASGDVNESGRNFVAYMFASCVGVSKVGSYTGTGTTLQVNCGFTNGSRFVLIKRTDSTGSWYVWDSARGIIAGNDPYLLLNDTAAEVTNTDYIDTYSAGFEISSTAPAEINASGGTFIYLAIA